MSITVYPIKVSTDFAKNYTYLVVNELNGKSLLIDPSWQPEKFVEKLNETGTTFNTILSTHSHFDHTNLDETLIDRYQPKVVMSKIEADYYNFEYNNTLLLENDNEIQIDGFNIKPILTPGHTKGSLCYLIGDNLFTGDTLFIEGCGLCEGNGASALSMYYSLQFLKENISDTTKIYPGHSYGREPGKPFSYLLNNNVYLRFENRETFVTYRTRKNQKNLFQFK